MTLFLAQIRKILGTNEQNDLILSSQRVENIDVVARDLCQELIVCSKIALPNRRIATITRENGRKIIKDLPAVFIMQHIFKGAYCVQNYVSWRDFGEKTYHARTGFFANPYFKYYDSYALIDFGQRAYL